MRTQLVRVAAFAAFAVIGSQLSAHEITYEFAGTVVDGNVMEPGPPLPINFGIGVPVTGTITYDLDAPGVPYAFGPTPDDVLGIIYTSPGPPARMTLSISDTVVQTTAGEGVAILVGNGVPSNLSEATVDSIIFASSPSQPAPVGLVLRLEDTTRTVLSSPALPAWIPLERFDLRLLEVQYPTGPIFLRITIHTFEPVARVWAIDILPGRFPNVLRIPNLVRHDTHDTHGQGLEVALLTTGARPPQLKVASVRFGATGVEAAPVQSVSKDVDSDGDKDLLFRFNIEETGIDCSTTSATLTATTTRGSLVRGSDATVPRPCKVEN